MRAIVSLGSNLGDRGKFLADALDALSALPDTRLVKASRVIETEPVGVPERYSSLKFLNQVAVFETGLDAHGFSCLMHKIEDSLGRVRVVANGPRTIDIDLVDFGGMRLDEPDLTLPHPRAKEREFVTKPLAELGISLCPLRRIAAGAVLTALSVTGFASTFVFGSALAGERHGISAVVLAFLRFLVSGSVMLAIALSTRDGRRKLFSPSVADFAAMAWLGPVGTSLMAWCVFMGCARVSAANASMADALAPLFIFAVAALKALHIGLRELAGLFFGFLGVLLVIGIVNTDGIALEAYTAGDVYVMLAAATWGVYTVCGRGLIARLGSSVFTTWTIIFGTLAIGLCLPFADGAWPSTAGEWFMVAMLGLVSTLLPFWTWNAAQKYVSMSVLGVSAYFTPVVAVALALVFLGERATFLQWTGTLLIVLAAMVETGGKKK